MLTAQQCRCTVRTHTEHMTKSTGLLHINKPVGTVDGSTEYFLMQIYLLVVLTDEEEGTYRDIRAARKSSKHLYPLNLSSFFFLSQLLKLNVSVVGSCKCGRGKNSSGHHFEILLQSV